MTVVVEIIRYRVIGHREVDPGIVAVLTILLPKFALSFASVALDPT